MIKPDKSGFVYLHNNITHLVDGSFDGCIELKNIVCNTKNLTSIGKWAFRGTNLTKVLLPNTLTFIHVTAFDECNSLTSVTFQGGSTPSKLISYGALKGATIDKCWTINVGTNFTTNVSNITSNANTKTKTDTNSHCTKITTPVSSVAFLGDSTMYRTISQYFRIHKLYSIKASSIGVNNINNNNNECKINDTKYYGKYLLKGWKMRGGDVSGSVSGNSTNSKSKSSKWILPKKSIEGPVQNGLLNHGQTDCSGCFYINCDTYDKISHVTWMNQVVYIPVEFTRDVTLQTDEYNTTQEVLSNYFVHNQYDLCVLSGGLHDQAIEGFTAEQYNINVLDYLKKINPTIGTGTGSNGCKRIVWIGLAQVQEVNKYRQRNKMGIEYNKIITTNALIMKYISNYINIYDFSKSGKYKMRDYIHYHNDFYKEIAEILPLLYFPKVTKKEIRKSHSHSWIKKKNSGGL